MTLYCISVTSGNQTCEVSGADVARRWSIVCVWGGERRRRGQAWHTSIQLCLASRETADERTLSETDLSADHSQHIQRGGGFGLVRWLSVPLPLVVGARGVSLGGCRGQIDRCSLARCCWSVLLCLVKVSVSVTLDAW